MTSSAKKKVIAAREKKNKPLNHISLEMETSTHFPVLIHLVQKVLSVEFPCLPILEMGSGLFSTPLLHWLCYERKRKLITCESYKHYLDFANKFKTLWHEIRFVKDWNKEKFEDKMFGVVFIDHSPKKPRTRADDALRFKDSADFIILHDAGSDSHEKYGYHKIYREFKYRYDWMGCLPHTTVLSNRHDLSDIHV